jgi:hypothetical protein
VAQSIVRRLHQELGKLVGVAGFDILLARSLVLARRAHPVLAGITTGPAGALAGLDDPAHERAKLQEGAMSIVEYFIELLVVLIGEDLAMRLLRDVWPGAAEEQTR